MNQTVETIESNPCECKMLPYDEKFYSEAVSILDRLIRGSVVLPFEMSPLDKVCGRRLLNHEYRPMYNWLQSAMQNLKTVTS